MLKQEKIIAPNFKGFALLKFGRMFVKYSAREVCISSIAQNNSLHMSILIDPKNLGTHLNRGKVVMCCRSPSRKFGKSHYLFNVLNTFPCSRTRISRFLPLGGWQGRTVIVRVHSRKRRLKW